MSQNFVCDTTPSAPIRTPDAAGAPERVTVSLSGFLAEVSEGQTVARGELLAKPVGEDAGFIHAPISGKVEALDLQSVHIVAEGDASVEPCNPAEVCGLEELGLDLTGIGRASTLIINGLNPEPDVCVSEALLAQQKETLERGLELLKTVVHPQRVVLAVREGSGHQLAGCETVQVSPVFPAVMDPMVSAAVTGTEKPGTAGALTVSVHRLWGFGRVAETGLPLTETVLSIGSHVCQVPVGTPAKDLLESLGASANTGDRVVFGGPFLGSTARSLKQGVNKDTYGLLVVPAGAYQPVQDAPCMECGGCVRICPSRVDPCLLAGLAEFKHWERARRSHVGACMECGLCGYVCPSRRPLLQYIRLAKAELAAIDEYAELADMAETAQT